MIRQAAIERHGVLYVGKRHSDIIAHHRFGFFKGFPQGFVTDRGLFLDRTRSAWEALRCGQIGAIKPLLYSEDLY